VFSVQDARPLNFQFPAFENHSEIGLGTRDCSSQRGNENAVAVTRIQISTTFRTSVLTN
jgi:hypothetical protein